VSTHIRGSLHQKADCVWVCVCGRERERERGRRGGERGRQKGEKERGRERARVLYIIGAAAGAREC